MKVIIDSEGMTFNYEPLEKGKEYDVVPQVAQVWIKTNRAHRSVGTTTESGSEGKTTEKAEGQSDSSEDTTGQKESGTEDEKKTSSKTAPQITADKKAGKKG